MPIRYRKYLTLAFATAALAMFAAACTSDPVVGDCLTPEDGVLVPSECTVPPGVTPDPTPTPTPDTGNGGGDPAVALLSNFGCGACHAIAGTPLNGAVGPALDNIGAQGADYVRESIVDPNAVIADGYPGGIMPQTFGDAIPADQLDQIVEYLSGLQ